MKKLIVVSSVLFLCVLMPLSAQLKVNEYGAVYVGSYGANPDSLNPTFDIPGLYVYGTFDYSAIYCKPGQLGYGMKIDGSTVSDAGPLLFLQGHNTSNSTLIQAYGKRKLCYSLTGEGVVYANNYITYTPKSSVNNGEMFKKIDSPLEKLMKLNGVLYQSSLSEISGNEKQTASSSQYRIGLRSEEVQSVIPEVVYTTPEGEIGVAYNELVGLLIEAMKEQQATISELQATVNELKSPSSMMNQMDDKAMLLQNVPNPFDKETRIGYVLPETVVTAQLLVYNLQGNQLKNISISGRGKGEIVIEASELNAGMYIYTLLADGKEVATKRMILTK